MKIKFTEKMYADLVIMMYKAGLENALELYKIQYPCLDQFPGDDLAFISHYATWDFRDNYETSTCYYQDLIELARINAWGEGVLLTKREAVQVLRKWADDDCTDGMDIMCKEYGHMSDSSEPNEDGSYDADMWSGLDPTDADTIEEFPEYQTFVLIQNGLDPYEPV